MRAVKIVLLSLALIVQLALACAAQEPGETTGDEPAGEPGVIGFTADGLERQLGLSPGELGGVTIAELPDPERGMLVCEGVEVEPYDYLPRESLDWLVYVPYEEDSPTRIAVIPDTSHALYTVISLVDDEEADGEAVAVDAAMYAWAQAKWGYYRSILGV
jgi:hypothetical protein